ncbi:MAG: TonB-dependent receptor, partial [Leeuwenhoekiella sp.]
MKVSNLFVLIFIFSLSPIFGQQNSVINLSQYLEKLESNFEVKFSYAVEDIDAVKIESIPEIKNIDEALLFLNKTTPLLFKKLSNRYITVSKQNKKINICAIIKDAATGQPLAGANITTSGKGTTSSNEGVFSLKDVKIGSKVVISFLGYGEKELNAIDLFSPDEKCLEILLQQENYALSEVIVTKFLTTGLQKSVDGKTVLNTEKFGILPGLIEPDILQTIQVLPGVESINESIANINVRGGTHDENQMLWDDITMYHSGHFFGLISAYNPNLTQRVEVSKNGTSSQYGGGVSSTISMHTKDEIPDYVKGGAGINLISGDAFVEIPLSDKLAVHLSGRRSVTDGWNTPTYDEYFKRSFENSEIRNSTQNTDQANSESQFYFYDYTAKLLYDASKKHKFRANFIGIDNKLDYSEQISSNGEMASKSSQLTQKNIAFGASWQADWNSSFHTKLNAYYTKYNIDANDLRIETDQLLTQQNEVLETGIKLNTFYEIMPNFKWLNGYQFTETGIRNATRVSNPLFNERIKDVLRSHSGYSELEYNQGTTFIRGGARVTYFEEFNKIRVEPRLNIRQKISGHIALKLLGEYKYQTATQIIDFEDDFLGVENRRWILANDEDIPLIQSKQISFGIDFKQNNWYLDA